MKRCSKAEEGAKGEEEVEEERRLHHTGPYWRERGIADGEGEDGQRGVWGWRVEGVLVGEREGAGQIGSSQAGSADGRCQPH